MKVNIMNYNEAVLGELIENALLNSMVWIYSICAIPHERVINFIR